MRPRVFPAEDARPAAAAREGYQRFNEAAGIPRGRQSSNTEGPAPSRCFNEAAGIPRGRHTYAVRA